MMGALGVILVMSQSASFGGLGIRGLRGPSAVSSELLCVCRQIWKSSVNPATLLATRTRRFLVQHLLSSKPATSKTSAHQSGNDIFLLEHLKYYPHLASGKECRLKVLHLSQPEATWMYLLIQQVGGNIWLYMIYKEPKHKQAHWKCQM